MFLKLERDTHNEFGTFGVLTFGSHKLYVVEQRWENNIPYRSCVPNGEYVLTYHTSPNHGGCYIIENLSLGVGKDEGDTRRWGCLFHIANLASELEGCIAPGLYRSYYKDAWSVASSKAAMDKLLEELGTNKNTKHRLAITNNFPTFEVR